MTKCDFSTVRQNRRMQCYKHKGHATDCATPRGATIGRRCKTCQKIFGLYSSRSRRVRCDFCCKRNVRRAKPKLETTAERRMRLESAANPQAPFIRMILWQSHLHTVGSKLGFCDRCKTMTDANDAVSLDTGPATQLMFCHACFDADAAALSGIAHGVVRDSRWIGDPETKRAAGMLCK